MRNILKINSSMRVEGSQSRILVDELAEALGGNIVSRDLAVDPVPFVTEGWINANFTPEEDRTDEQRKLLSGSDRLIEELEAADTLVIGLPIYNFAMPAALKAWIDQIARARRTFRYTEEGPEGLLKGKKAYVVMASGGTEAGSEIDFATGYLRYILGFIGITDVTLIAADRLMFQAEESLASARETIDALRQEPEAA